MVINKKCNTYNWGLVDGIYTSIITNHDIEYHDHMFWEISVTISGEYINHFENIDIKCTPYFMVIIRPGDKHYIGLKDSKATYRDIYVKDEDMKEACNFISKGLYEKLSESKNPIVCKIDKTHLDSLECSAHLISIAKISLKKEEIVPIFRCFVMNALSAYIESEVVITNNVPKWLLNLIDEINTYRFSTFSFCESYVEKLINNTGYSHGHVCREFKKYFGCTLINYINNKRLLLSTSLLLNSDFTISQISQYIGYSNQSNFINSFKKQYGDTPYSYRKKCRM